MPLNNRHAFANGSTSAQPAPYLFAGPLLWLMGSLERLAGRYAAEKAWRQFTRHAVLGSGCRLGPAAWCVNPGPREAIALGTQVVCRGGLRRESFGGGQIVLHDFVYIGDDVLISAAARVEVGRFAMLAHGAQLFDNDSHPVDADQREAHYRAILAGHAADAPPIAAAPIMIGERAWIGMNAFIGKGVTIGDGSIVAAGSIVTRDIPPRSLAAGNPAQVIKSL